MENYLYIWWKEPSKELKVNPSRSDDIWFKIEGNSLSLINKDYYDCYKVVGNDVDDIDQKVDYIVKKIIKVKKIKSLIEDSAMHDNEILGDMSKKGSNKYIKEMMKVNSNIYKMKRQIMLYNELMENYKKIETGVISFEKSNIGGYLDKNQATISSINSDLIKLEEEYDNLEMEHKKSERKRNICFSLIGVIIGALSIFYCL